jgi:hypothetical protein
MVTITVDVFGGIPPTEIEVFIENTSTKKNETHTHPSSFTSTHNLDAGDYVIQICGLSPEGGRTEISITCDNCSFGPVPNKATYGDENPYVFASSLTTP